MILNLHVKHVPTPEEAFAELIAAGTLPNNADPEGSFAKCAVHMHIHGVIEGNQLVRRAQALAESMPPLDNCRFCRGAKGGMRGNENIVGGVTCCDDCTILAAQIESRTAAAIAKMAEAHAQPPFNSSSRATIDALVCGIRSRAWTEYL